MSFSWQAEALDRIRAVAKVVPLNMTYGPWVAGGCARGLVTGEQANDVDLFFASKEQKADALTRLQPYFCESQPSTGSDAVSSYYEVPGAGLVNFAGAHEFKNVAELLGSFDITVCMFAADGDDVYPYHKRVLEHVENKTLLVVRPTYRRRILKYTSYGYALGVAQESIFNAGPTHPDWHTLITSEDFVNSTKKRPWIP